MSTIEDKHNMIQWIDDALGSEGSRALSVLLAEDLWHEAHEEREQGESLEDYMNRVDLIQRASDLIDRQDLGSRKLSIDPIRGGTR